MRHNLPGARQHFATEGRDIDLDTEVLYLALREALERLDSSEASTTATTLNLRRAADMSIPMLVGQVDDLAIAPLGAAGEPEPVTNITWTSDTPSTVQIVAAADGLSAEATALIPGTANVNVTAVNSAGVTLSASQAYTVTEPATGLNLTAGAPKTPAPAAAPAPAPGA